MCLAHPAMRRPRLRPLRAQQWARFRSKVSHLPQARIARAARWHRRTAHFGRQKPGRYQASDRRLHLWGRGPGPAQWSGCWRKASGVGSIGRPKSTKGSVPPVDAGTARSGCASLATGDSAAMRGAWPGAGASVAAISTSTTGKGRSGASDGVGAISGSTGAVAVSIWGASSLGAVMPTPESSVTGMSPVPGPSGKSCQTRVATPTVTKSAAARTAPTFQ